MTNKVKIFTPNPEPVSGLTQNQQSAIDIFVEKIKDEFGFKSNFDLGHKLKSTYDYIVCEAELERQRPRTSDKKKHINRIKKLARRLYDALEEAGNQISFSLDLCLDIPEEKHQSTEYLRKLVEYYNQKNFLGDAGGRPTKITFQLKEYLRKLVELCNQENFLKDRGGRPAKNLGRLLIFQLKEIYEEGTQKAPTVSWNEHKNPPGYDGKFFEFCCKIIGEFRQILPDNVIDCLPKSDLGIGETACKLLQKLNNFPHYKKKIK